MSIVCNPQAITLTPSSPISVPSGYKIAGHEIQGTLNSVEVNPKATDNVVLHGTFLGFKKDVVRTV